MAKLKPEDIQYRIPGACNRFVNVYRKPIFYILIIGIFAVVTAFAVAYNMSYFKKANKNIIYINCPVSYEGNHVRNYASLNVYLNRIRRNAENGEYLNEFDIYFTRYDTGAFTTTDESYNTVWDYNRHFGGTVLESVYASNDLDAVPCAFYIVDATRSTIIKQVTYEEIGLERDADLALEQLPTLFEQWVTA